MTNNIFLHENAFMAGVKKPEKIIKKLNHGKIFKGIYVVYFNEEFSKLEIMDSRFFNLPNLKNHRIIVCCLASSYDDALEYIRCITEISFNKYSDIKLIDTINDTSVFEISAIFNNEDEE